MDPTSTTALQTRAYTVLTKYLLDHEDEVLNIETLPPAFPPPNGICMIEGPNLGLPKETLALAFLEARKRFLANYQDGPLSIVSLIAPNKVVNKNISCADTLPACLPSNPLNPPLRPRISHSRQLSKTAPPSPEVPPIHLPSNQHSSSRPRRSAG
jgi:hypothetical protein